MIARDVFKANDLRGLVGGPDAQWDADGAHALGAAFVHVLALAGREFVLGRDMRPSGPELATAFAAGARAQGASVVDLGLTSTDELWFASGSLGLPGAQFTASHNPAGYNGIKFCQAGAAPVSGAFLSDLARVATGPALPSATVPGGARALDVLDAYAAHLHALVPLTGHRPLRVVVDAGNGMAGLTTPAVLGHPGLDVVGLYLELDGSFPNHPPNPLVPENLLDARGAVVEHRADLGLVFDGDADRCFIIDERGDVVSPSVLTALIAVRELEREPRSTVVVNSLTSRSVAEAVEAAGGRVVVSRVGHTFIKAAMAETGALFGGEHSAHYYFRDFWGADTGMLAALHVLAALGEQDAPLSALAAPFAGWVPSGELNSTVADAGAATAAVGAAFADRGRHDHSDGLTVHGPDWWLNVRSSNTEPLLRLNVEARDTATMEALRDEVLAIIRRSAA